MAAVPYLKWYYKLGLFMLVMLLLTSCPGENTDGNDLGSVVRVDDLMLLKSNQITYIRGDVLTLIVNISSNNSFYGNDIDIFQSTNDNAALLVMNSGIFTGNSLTFDKGSQGEYINWLNIPYNPETEMYELELRITLNRIGDYFLVTDDSIYF